ncbi:MAG: S8 family serine peptidase [Chloroflexota bacterium]
MMRRALALIVAAVLAAGSMPAGGRGGAASPAAAGAADRYIVQTGPSAGDPAAVAADLAKRYGIAPGHVYRTAIRGFSARIPGSAMAAVRADRRVRQVSPDTEFRPHIPRPEPFSQPRDFPATGQTTPPGIARIQAPENPLFGAGPVDVDVAVIDTGVWAGHPDLNVVGGRNCVQNEPNRDLFGHGTHVAGTIGAIDNDFGVVGVAPGARIWSVKVLDRNGAGRWSDVICGIDWVAANASVIEVANMSLGGYWGVDLDDGRCGRSLGDAYHAAICAAVRAGVVFVVAAGNACSDARLFIPGGYPEAITVAAFADTDGQPGGYGPAGTSKGCGEDGLPIPNNDDSIGAFTNTGKPVDLWAPGVNVLSTYLPDPLSSNRPYAVLSGTSMAAPHAAGAAALILAANPSLKPSAVSGRLVSGAERRRLPNGYAGAEWNGKRKESYRARIVNLNDGPAWPPQPYAGG